MCIEYTDANGRVHLLVEIGQCRTKPIDHFVLSDSMQWEDSSHHSPESLVAAGPSLYNDSVLDHHLVESLLPRRQVSIWWFLEGKYRLG